MSKNKRKPESENPPPAEPQPVEQTGVESAAAGDVTTHSGVSLRYAGESQLVSGENSSQLALFGNLERDPVYLDAIVKHPLELREALTSLYAIVGSDYRYAPKDRTAYMAYMRMRRESANLNSWQAQQAYFDWLLRNDPLAFCILDPVITVHPDKLFFEVFSKDEGTYANLSVRMDAFDVQGTPRYGTTNIDFSEKLFESIRRFRTWRQTRLTIGQEAVEFSTVGGTTVLEKKIQVPDSWLRGFLQVQSAAMLPYNHFRLAPIDLYNALRHLRMRADQKGKRRGLRVELIPGEYPRLVLEPWETVIESSGAKYQGNEARVFRVWGRRRLSMLRHMLPLATDIDVYLTGSGLPSYWVISNPRISMTMAITGFTSANWSKALDFDLMLPRQAVSEEPLKVIVKHLSSVWKDNSAGLAKVTKLTGEPLVAQVQRGCQNGQLMIDVPDQVYRLRPLTDVPLDLKRLEFRNQRERQAHDLNTRKNAVSIVSENRIVGSGLELTGKTLVEEDRREYRPQLLISDEGFVSRADCTCNLFRSQGLKSGPCAHLIALRLAYGIRQRSSKSKTGMLVETRTYSQRKNGKETVYQISLDRSRIKVHWGLAGQPPRIQQLQFPSTNEAREDYLARIANLVAAGYLDASSED